MISSKTIIIVAFVLLINVGFAKADIGSGVKVSLLDDEIIGSTTADIKFEISNLNPVGSASINAFAVLIPPEFAVTGETNHAGLSIDAGETENFSFSLEAPNPDSDKDYYIRFKVEFTDGSISTRKESLKVLADRVAPLSEIKNIKNAAYFSELPIQINFSVLDMYPSSGIKKLELSINNGEFFDVPKTEGKFSYSFKPSADNAYELSYRSYDNAGNAEKKRTLLVYYDSTPPMVSFEPFPSATNNPVPQLGFKFTDQLAETASCVVEMGSYKEKVFASRNSVSYALFPEQKEGNYSAVARCTDNAGNTGNSSVLLFSIDTKPPSILNITYVEGIGSAENRTVIVEFDKKISAGDLQKLLVLVQGGKTLDVNISTANNKTFALIMPKLSPGTDYKIVVDKELKDEAGNRLNSSQEFAFKTSGGPTIFAVLTRSLTMLGILFGLIVIFLFAFAYYRMQRRRKFGY